VELQDGHGFVSDPTSASCPFSLHLWFSRPTYHTDNAVVASLTAADGAPLTITDCAGKPASTGNLVIGMDMRLLADGDSHPGHIVVKELAGAAVRRGPVVSGLRSENPIIELVPEAGVLPDADGFYYGRLLIRYQDPALAARELDVSLYALDGATEEKYAGMFYLGFVPGRQSAARGRLDVPSTGMPAGQFAVALALRVICTAAGALPDLQLSYRRLPPADAPAALPGDASEITLPAVALSARTAAAANIYFDYLTAPMQARAGETLMFTLRRHVDPYSGVIGVIRSRGVLG
jgi:hypothetical protein